MKIQLIRNATMKIEYGGKTFLTDPMLSPKGAIRSFAGIAENPTVDLPMSVDEVLQGVDAVIVSHNHPDHLDEPALASLDKTLPVFCQPCDDSFLVEKGFERVFPINSKHTWEGIDFHRTGGRHGQGEIGKLMGEVSGFVLQASGEPTLYWAGDSNWCHEVKEAIKKFSPDVIITHSGGAALPGHDPIIMTGEQTMALVQAASDAKVVAVHMESLDHCTVTREGLRKMGDEASIPGSRLIIPKDGETVNL
ncbi:beta-lactamase [Desulfatibacillum aliphaticivorans]|uniref:Beta-lactamase n=1 Tax=Desulfatibacillum aliphaticivorans TaxID=218208 RepID=B8FI13_DESAL|nr:MBL fold metallo-hydrolase [Desulfatibacillum aliphaticivorans]ACL02580.1 beta-lactamase [Desulfatibacillum aliphaticivorans]